MAEVKMLYYRSNVNKYNNIIFIYMNEKKVDGKRVHVPHVQSAKQKLWDNQFIIYIKRKEKKRESDVGGLLISRILPLYLSLAQIIIAYKYNAFLFSPFKSSVYLPPNISKMASWKKTIATPFKKACTFFNHQPSSNSNSRDKKSQAGIITHQHFS